MVLGYLCWDIQLAILSTLSDNIQISFGWPTGHLIAQRFVGELWRYEGYWNWCFCLTPLTCLVAGARSVWGSSSLRVYVRRSLSRRLLNASLLFRNRPCQRCYDADCSSSRRSQVWWEVNYTIDIDRKSVYTASWLSTGWLLFIV